MSFYLVAGIVVLYLTYRDFVREETDTIFLFDFWAWFEVSRSSFPLLYWAALIAQLICGIGLLICALKFL